MSYLKITLVLFIVLTYPLSLSGPNIEEIGTRSNSYFNDKGKRIFLACPNDKELSLKIKIATLKDQCYEEERVDFVGDQTPKIEKRKQKRKTNLQSLEKNLQRIQKEKKQKNKLSYPYDQQKIPAKKTGFWLSCGERKVVSQARVINSALILTSIVFKGNNTCDGCGEDTDGDLRLLSLYIKSKDEIDLSWNTPPSKDNHPLSYECPEALGTSSSRASKDIFKDIAMSDGSGEINKLLESNGCKDRSCIEKIKCCRCWTKNHEKSEFWRWGSYNDLGIAYIESGFKDLVRSSIGNRKQSKESSPEKISSGISLSSAGSDVQSCLENTSLCSGVTLDNEVIGSGISDRELVNYTQPYSERDPLVGSKETVL